MATTTDTLVRDDATQGYQYGFKGTDENPGATLSLRLPVGAAVTINGGTAFPVVNGTGTLTNGTVNQQITIPGAGSYLYQSGGVGGSYQGLDDEGLQIAPDNASLSWEGPGKTTFAYQDPMLGYLQFSLTDTTFPSS